MASKLRQTDKLIGSRTGLRVLQGKIIRRDSRGKEILDDYFTDVETESDVSDASGGSARSQNLPRKSNPDRPQEAAVALSQKPSVKRRILIGSRSGIPLFPNKIFRRDSKGRENIDDYFTDIETDSNEDLSMDVFKKSFSKLDRKVSGSPVSLPKSASANNSLKVGPSGEDMSSSQMRKRQLRSPLPLAIAGQSSKGLLRSPRISSIGSRRKQSSNDFRPAPQSMESDTNYAPSTPTNAGPTTEQDKGSSKTRARLSYPSPVIVNASPNKIITPTKRPPLHENRSPNQQPTLLSFSTALDKNPIDDEIEINGGSDIDVDNYAFRLNLSRKNVNASNESDDSGKNTGRKNSSAAQTSKESKKSAVPSSSNSTDGEDPSSSQNRQMRSFTNISHRYDNASVNAGHDSKADFSGRISDEKRLRRPKKQTSSKIEENWEPRNESSVRKRKSVGNISKGRRNDSKEVQDGSERRRNSTTKTNTKSIKSKRLSRQRIVVHFSEDEMAVDDPIAVSDADASVRSNKSQTKHSPIQSTSTSTSRLDQASVLFDKLVSSRSPRNRTPLKDDLQVASVSLYRISNPAAGKSSPKETHYSPVSSPRKSPGSRQNVGLVHSTSKKRGRPRKTPVPDPSSIPPKPTGSHRKVGLVHSTPKKRGRPRKTAVPDPSSIPPKPTGSHQKVGLAHSTPKKRGRPRKTSVVVNDPGKGSSAEFGGRENVRNAAVPDPSSSPSKPSGSRQKVSPVHHKSKKLDRFRMTSVLAVNDADNESFSMFGGRDAAVAGSSISPSKKRGRLSSKKLISIVNHTDKESSLAIETREDMSAAVAVAGSSSSPSTSPGSLREIASVRSPLKKRGRPRKNVASIVSHTDKESPLAFKGREDVPDAATGGSPSSPSISTESLQGIDPLRRNSRKLGSHPKEPILIAYNSDEETSSVQWGRKISFVKPTRARPKREISPSVSPSASSRSDDKLKKQKRNEKRKAKGNHVEQDLPDSPQPNYERPKRHCSKPLEFWRNERIIYRRDSKGFPSYVGVDPGLDPLLSEFRIQSKPFKNENKASKEKRITKKPPTDVSDEEENKLVVDQAEIEDKNFVRRKQRPILVINPMTEEEVLIDCVKVKDSHVQVSMTGQLATVNDGVVVCKPLIQKAFASGVLMIKPHTSKGMSYLKTDTIIFHVMQGILEVTIHETVLTVWEGDQFFIPQGNKYDLQNTSDRQVKLVFFQLMGNLSCISDAVF